MGHNYNSSTAPPAHLSNDFPSEAATESLRRYIERFSPDVLSNGQIDGVKDEEAYDDPAFCFDFEGVVAICAETVWVFMLGVIVLLYLIG